MLIAAGGRSQETADAERCGAARTVCCVPPKHSHHHNRQSLLKESLTSASKADIGSRDLKFCGPLQEDARKLQTLKDVEPLIQSRLSGPKGSMSQAAASAAEQYLQKEPYDQVSLKFPLQNDQCAQHPTGPAITTQDALVLSRRRQTAKRHIQMQKIVC